jgi:hypothetical protein
MLSILIPTYNYNVEELVAELYAQASASNIDFEIIIGDDFSDQNIYNKSDLKNSKLVKLYRSHYSIGRTAMREILSTKALYNWILYIDSDMIPSQNKYIENYIDAILKNKDIKAFFGGYSYSNQHPKSDRLRFRYGVSRESKSAVNREINPYRNIYSGNMLISRESFKLTNISLENRYGLDLAFSSELESKNIPFKHLDNYTNHVGIDDNYSFLLKSKEASRTIRYLYDQNLISSKQSKLVWAYKLIEKLHMTKVVEIKGRLFNPIISWMLINFKAPLITLDFYKLYHFCKK